MKRLVPFLILGLVLLFALVMIQSSRIKPTKSTRTITSAVRPESDSKTMGIEHSEEEYEDQPNEHFFEDELPKCMHLPKFQETKVQLFHKLLEGVSQLPVDKDIEHYMKIKDEQVASIDSPSDVIKLYMAIHDWTGQEDVDAIHKLDELKDHENGFYSIQLADMKSSFYMNGLKYKDTKILDEIVEDVTRGIRKPFYDSEYHKMKSRIYELGMLSPEKYEIAAMLEYHFRLELPSPFIFETAADKDPSLQEEIMNFAKRNLVAMAKLQYKPQGYYWSGTEFDAMNSLYKNMWRRIHKGNVGSADSFPDSYFLPGNEKQNHKFPYVDYCADLDVFKKQWQERKDFFKTN